MRQIPAHVRLQHPPCRERPGKARHHHLGDPQLTRDEHRVHRPRAPERHQHELTRLDTVLHRQRPDRLRHPGVGHVAHALGQPQRIELQLPGQLRHRDPGRLGVQRHQPAREPGRIHPPQHHVRVRDRDLGAAPAVARGPGNGPRRLGTHPQRARLGVGDGATARADRVQVHHRHQHRMTLDPRLRADVGPPVHDERHVERRAAHVHADRVVPPEQPGRRDPAHRPADRPRQQRLQRPAHRVRGVHQPARRLHDVHRHRQPPLGEAPLDPAQITAHHRPRVRLQYRRGRPLVLPPLPGHLVRQHDQHILTQLGPQNLTGPHLVRRIGEGEQQAHRHRVEPLRTSPPRRRPHRLLVQRHELPPPVVQPPARLHDVLPRHQRRRLAVAQVEHALPVAPGDLVDVPGPPARQQQHPCALAFQQRVETLRGAVHEEGDVRRIVHDPRERGEHPLREIPRRGGRLRGGDGPRPLVVTDDVGEGAADVHGDAISHARHRMPPDPGPSCAFRTARHRPQCRSQGSVRRLEPGTRDDQNRRGAASDDRSGAASDDHTAVVPPPPTVTPP